MRGPKISTAAINAIIRIAGETFTINAIIVEAGETECYYAIIMIVKQDKPNRESRSQKYCPYGGRSVWSGLMSANVSPGGRNNCMYDRVHTTNTLL